MENRIPAQHSGSTILFRMFSGNSCRTPGMHALLLQPDNRLASRYGQPEFSFALVFPGERFSFSNKSSRQITLFGKAHKTATLPGKGFLSVEKIATPSSNENFLLHNSEEAGESILQKSGNAWAFPLLRPGKSTSFHKMKSRN